MNTRACLFLIILAVSPARETWAVAPPAPVLTWVPGSSIKKEQLIGDVDWEAAYYGSNLPTASLTVTRKQ